MAFDGAGNIYVTNYFASTIGKYDATTGAAVNASLVTGLSTPQNLAFDANGTLFVASLGNNGVQAFNATTGTAVSAPLLGGVSNTWGIAFDEANNFYTSLYFSGAISKFTAAGVTISNPLATLVADGPTSLVYVVPEPTALGIAGCAVAVAASVMRRRRSS